ncbi:MAG: 50S ribosomal protein L23 [Phycisphaerales bacterium]
MQPHYIIRKPLLTEKSTMGMEEGQYVFEVDRRASKTDIKDAVERAYGVNVVGVTTQVRKGKVKRTRYGYVKEGTTKKATVRVKEGQVIELF